MCVYIYTHTHIFYIFILFYILYLISCIKNFTLNVYHIYLGVGWEFHILYFSLKSFLFCIVHYSYQIIVQLSTSLIKTLFSLFVCFREIVGTLAPQERPLWLDQGRSSPENQGSLVTLEIRALGDLMARKGHMEIRWLSSVYLQCREREKCFI